MRIYFYDENKRYIGNRELNEGENIPAYATTLPVEIGDKKEAYLINNEWIINDIIEDEVIQS